MDHMYMEEEGGEASTDGGHWKEVTRRGCIPTPVAREGGEGLAGLSYLRRVGGDAVEHGQVPEAPGCPL